MGGRNRGINGRDAQIRRSLRQQHSGANPDITNGHGHPPAGDNGSVVNLAFSPDGRALVSGSLVGTVRVWDAASGEKRFVLEGYQGPVPDVAGREQIAVLADHDGPVLGMAFNASGLVRIYVTSTAELMALAQSRLTRRLTATECQQFLHRPQCPDYGGGGEVSTGPVPGR